jgi:ankyrin repeat protein
MHHYRHFKCICVLVVTVVHCAHCRNAIAQQGAPLLEKAIVMNDPILAEEALANGASVGQRYSFGGNVDLTPLMVAAWKNRSASVTKVLLKAGAKLEDVDKGGTTPLMYAVDNENSVAAEIVSTLLAAGARANHLIKYADENGRAEYMSALGIASLRCRDLAVVKALLAGGADPNVSRSFGNKPLLLAAGSRGKHAAETVAILLAAGADVRDNDNRTRATPLFAGVINEGPQAVEIVKLLLAAGSDVTEVNKGGYTPMALARLARNYHKQHKMSVLVAQTSEIIEILRAAGAKK